MTRLMTFRFVQIGLCGLLAALTLMALTPLLASAQPVPGQEPGIVAVGFGEASAAASTASLQFLIGSDQFGGFMGPQAEVVPAEEEGDPAATAAAEGMPPGMGMFGPPSLTAEQLDPVVDALTAAGAAAEAIEVNVPVPVSAFTGPGGPEIGEIRVTVDQPEQDQLVALVDAGRAAIAGAGLSVFHVGATYDTADCEALIQEAREAAVADAQARAEGLATAIGATLGDLVQASETPYFGPTGSGSCAAALPADIFGYGPFGPGTDPPFDPSAAAEAEVYIQVALTYAFGE